MSSSPAGTHRWKFYRTGGLDQVALESGADLLALDQLDQKLWAALSCPVKGLELDDKTLALIDTDGDGRIRVPELIHAVKWASARLKNPGDLLLGREALPLSAIADTDEGKTLAASARQILANLKRKEADAISVNEAANTAAIFAASPLNGDGVIPPEATDDPAVQALIKDIVKCMGGANDRTGSTGVTAVQIEQFFAQLSDYEAWLKASAAKDIAILGEATGTALNAIRTLRAKIDDYFAREKLAVFDPRAASALNRGEADYVALAGKSLNLAATEVAEFPLARVEAGRPLPLLNGVNPAWADALATLHRTAITPIFGANHTTLTYSEWLDLNRRFAAYETWLGSKTGGAVEQLGVERIQAILASTGRASLAQLIERDRALEPEYKAISDVERLARYFRDLRTLLHNFVNFVDFFSPDRLATFQAGTLYIDSRATELCVRVDAPSPLAAMSKVYISYCNCTRAGSPPMTIAACFTQGDSDYLFVGRHGVFYDRAGRDWDAVVTSIVDNPISIRQAFWSPYKKFIRFVEEQVAKRAAAAEAASSGKLAAAAETAANVDKQGPAVAPKKIDVGTVAALGVAVGAIGGALGAIATGLAKLAWWQLPLVLIGLMLVISVPSMLIAWLKLRQRTLGPILEGNGWAVNGRVKINLPFGATLTETAQLPPGAKRSLEDPYEDKDAARARRRVILLLVLLVLAGAAFWVRWDHNRRGHYFWEPAPTPPPAAAATPPPAQATK